ncbi:hypothetical protein [Streptomyces venezuelae]
MLAHPACERGVPVGDGRAQQLGVVTAAEEDHVTVVDVEAQGALVAIVTS